MARTLKEVRMDVGMAQHELALRVGIGRTRVSLLESGYVEARPDEKQRIAAVLGVRVEQIEWPCPEVLFPRYEVCDAG